MATLPIGMTQSKVPPVDTDHKFKEMSHIQNSEHIHPGGKSEAAMCLPLNDDPSPISFIKARKAPAP
jgi:hypothetical protein